MIKPRAASVAISILFLIGLLAGTSVPANADMDDNCTLSLTVPTTDGVYVYGTSKVVCYTYMDYTAAQVGIKIQEKVGVYWTDRTGWKYKYSGGTTRLEVSDQYYCNGHGTDLWRGYGYGETTDGGGEYASGPSASLTC